MECDGPVVRKGPGARRGLPQRSVEQLLLPARQDGVVEWFAAPDAQRYEQIPRRYADPHVVEQIRKRLRLDDCAGTVLFPSGEPEQSGLELFDGKSGLRNSRIPEFGLQFRFVPVENQHDMHLLMFPEKFPPFLLRRGCGGQVGLVIHSACAADDTFRGPRSLKRPCPTLRVVLVSRDHARHCVSCSSQKTMPDTVCRARLRCSVRLRRTCTFEKGIVNILMILLYRRYAFSGMAETDKNISFPV